jgi:acyl dehydratase
VTVTLTGADQLLASTGTQLGPTDWIQVTQAEVDAFAALTGDRNWLHVDPVAAAAGPFGRTIVHGYFTMCLIPMLLSEILAVSDAGTPVNYGCNRVRFPRPLGVEERFRMSAVVSSVEAVRSGIEFVLTASVECEDDGKPACVADVVIRYLGTEPEATT